VANIDISDIITSPEAERMRRMVTKDFYDRSRLGLWLYEAIGREWDEMGGWAKELKLEIFPQTCTWSISIWEWVYGFETDDTLQLEYRRQRILAKIIQQSPINPETIRRGVAALTGADVEVHESTVPYTFDVVIHPSENPLNYFEVWRYVREVKPSHLAFHAEIETKIDITVEIGTTYNLLGYGLTGLYNAGMRPNTNIKAELRTFEIEVTPNGISARVDPPLTGTVPQPNVLFTQDELAVEPDIKGAGYKSKPPMTTETQQAGTIPHTEYGGGAGQTDLGADITTKAAKAPYTPTGTKPGTANPFIQGDIGIGGDVSALGAKFAYPATGTKPQANTLLDAADSGIAPTVTTRSYKITFKMCGTGLTASD
jgi:hypothetical protein